MDALDKEIAYNIKRVVGVLDTASPRFPIMSGVVKSVNEGELTCTVLLTVDGGEPTEGVLLVAMPDNGNGLVLVPKVNSAVLVAEIDGPGRWAVIRTTYLTKVLLSADVVIEMNGGENGGVPKVAKVDDNLNALKDYIKDVLEPAISAGFDAVGAALAANGALGKTAFELLTNPATIAIVEMENTKVTH